MFLQRANKRVGESGSLESAMRDGGLSGPAVVAEVSWKSKHLVSGDAQNRRNALYLLALCEW